MNQIECEASFELVTNLLYKLWFFNHNISFFFKTWYSVYVLWNRIIDRFGPGTIGFRNPEKDYSVYTN